MTARHARTPSLDAEPDASLAGRMALGDYSAAGQPMPSPVRLPGGRETLPAPSGTN